MAQLPSIVRDVNDLVSEGIKFATIYADPPWEYSNTASRGAARNHYSTLSVAQISQLPIKSLAASSSHLHLWTTNAFLRDAFDVMEAWGFSFKSSLIWVKPQLGMGNYWRVSHEFLLLGVRGSAPFLDNTCRSWIAHPRSKHSKKPFTIRALVERVSPGPYLELFGREEFPRSEWTVFGNQVERRLF